MKNYVLSWREDGVSAASWPQETITAASDEEAQLKAQEFWGKMVRKGKGVSAKFRSKHTFLSFAEVRDLGWKPQ